MTTGPSILSTYDHSAIAPKNLHHLQHLNHHDRSVAFLISLVFRHQAAGQKAAEDLNEAFLQTNAHSGTGFGQACFDFDTVVAFSQSFTEDFAAASTATGLSGSARFTGVIIAIGIS